MSKSENKKGHQCSYCGEAYRKQDFSVCPFCGGDGGGITARVWRPTKRQKKEYAKKNINNN